MGRLQYAAWVADYRREWFPFLRSALALTSHTHSEPFDPVIAARLEVSWWRGHRDHQQSNGNGDERPLHNVRLATRLSDLWVRNGCERASALIDEERTALVRSHAALLAAVYQP